MSFRNLKAFLEKENLFHSKIARDTNNGRIITLEVRTVKMPVGKEVIFVGRRWYTPGEYSEVKIMDSLASEFFRTIGMTPPLNLEAWGLDVERAEKKVSDEEEVEEVIPKTQKIKKSPFAKKAKAKIHGVRVAPKSSKEEEDDINSQIDKILEEEDEEIHEMNPMEKLMGVTEGIKDMSPSGMLEALSTPGGLGKIGSALQDPAILAMLGPMMSHMMSAMPQMPPGANTRKTPVAPKPVTSTRTSTPEEPEIVEEL